MPPPNVPRMVETSDCNQYTCLFYQRYSVKHDVRNYRHISITWVNSLDLFATQPEMMKQIKLISCPKGNCNVHNLEHN